MEFPFLACTRYSCGKRNRETRWDQAAVDNHFADNGYVLRVYGSLQHHDSGKAGSYQQLDTVARYLRGDNDI